jgi:alpha-galactosidase
MLSSMQGSLGIGANIAKWTPEETATGQAPHRRLSPGAAHHRAGRSLPLISPRNGSEFSATQTVRDKSQSVVFAFIHSTQQGRGFPALKLKGLDPEAEYKLSFIEGKAFPDTPGSASGAWWMRHGINLDLRGDFRAAAFPSCSRSSTCTTPRQKPSSLFARPLSRRSLWRAG